MATICIPSEDRTLAQPERMAAFLAPLGMIYQRWPLEDRVDRDAGADEILEAYAPEIERLKQWGGYQTADVINITPDLEGLQEMLDRFNKEHRHTEDEVRFIIKGAGLFHIHPEAGPVFSITVEAGDLLTVPAGMRHWFDLCQERTIRAIRLFKDMSGWTPHYEQAGIHGEFTPMCWGPRHVATEAADRPAAFKPSVDFS